MSPAASCRGRGWPARDWRLSMPWSSAGLAKSNSESRRIVTQGGAYVNNRRVGDLQARLGPGQLAGESILVLRAGKKNYALLRFTE